MKSNRPVASPSWVGRVTPCAPRLPRARAKFPGVAFPTRCRSSASLRWWTESRCDSVCLRSRHFVATPCPSAHACFRPRAGSAVRALDQPLKRQNPPKLAEITLLSIITMNERLQTRVARATGPYRPATRRTERVRRSISQRTPFVIGAPSCIRHSPFVIRHSQTEMIKNPRNITFYALKPHPTMTQRIIANPRLVGRVTPCAPRLPPARAKFPRRRLPDPLPIKTWLAFPVPTSEFGLNPEPLRLKPETFNLKPS